MSSIQSIARCLALLLAPLLLLARPAESQVDFRDIGHFQGNPFAPVQVIEFADYGCSACGMFTRDVKPQVYRNFIETGRIGWRIVPISLARFRHSVEATRAAECAGEQDKFWEVEQSLYDRQKEWQGARQAEPVLRQIAEAKGVEVRRWTACYRNGSRPSPLPGNNTLARTFQVRGTPTFLINDRRAMGALPYDQFAELLEQAEIQAFQ